MIDLDEILTPVEAAGRLKCSARMVRGMCARGAVRGAFRLGSLWRIPAWAIVAMAGGARAPAEEARADLSEGEGGKEDQGRLAGTDHLPGEDDREDGHGFCRGEEHSRLRHQ